MPQNKYMTSQLKRGERPKSRAVEGLKIEKPTYRAASSVPHSKKRRSYKNDIEKLMKNSNKKKIRQINTLVVPNNGESRKKITISIRRLVLHYLIPMTLQNVL